MGSIQIESTATRVRTYQEGIVLESECAVLLAGYCFICVFRVGDAKVVSTGMAGDSTGSCTSLGVCLVELHVCKFLFYPRSLFGIVATER